MCTPTRRKEGRTASETCIRTASSCLWACTDLVSLVVEMVPGRKRHGSIAAESSQAASPSCSTWRMGEGAVASTTTTNQKVKGGMRHSSKRVSLISRFFPSLLFALQISMVLVVGLWCCPLTHARALHTLRTALLSLLPTTPPRPMEKSLRVQNKVDAGQGNGRHGPKVSKAKQAGKLALHDDGNQVAQAPRKRSDLNVHKEEED